MSARFASALDPFGREAYEQALGIPSGSMLDALPYADWSEAQQLNALAYQSNQAEFAAAEFGEQTTAGLFGSVSDANPGLVGQARESLPISKNAWNDKLGGVMLYDVVAPDLLETGARPYPNGIIDGEDYQYVPYVYDAENDPSLAYYVAYNPDTKDIDWAVTPSKLDYFQGKEGYARNFAAGFNPNEYELASARVGYYAAHGRLDSAIDSLAESWSAALQDRGWWLNTALSVSGGMLARGAVANSAKVAPKKPSVIDDVATQSLKGKYTRRADISYRPADDVNSTFPSGWEPPYKPGTRVTEFTTTVDDVYVRVHGETNKARSWMMKREAIEGLTPQQIQSKYALPEVPTFISEVHVPSGTRIRTGTVNPVFDGVGNATQYELLQRLPESVFINSVRLGQ
jgi:hypothetical protein